MSVIHTAFCGQAGQKDQVIPQHFGLRHLEPWRCRESRLFPTRKSLSCSRRPFKESYLDSEPNACRVSASACCDPLELLPVIIFDCIFRVSRPDTSGRARRPPARPPRQTSRAEDCLSSTNFDLGRYRLSVSALCIPLELLVSHLAVATDTKRADAQFLAWDSCHGFHGRYRKPRGQTPTATLDDHPHALRVRHPAQKADRALQIPISAATTPRLYFWYYPGIILDLISQVAQSGIFRFEFGDWDEERFAHHRHYYGTIDASLQIPISAATTPRLYFWYYPGIILDLISQVAQSGIFRFEFGDWDEERFAHHRHYYGTIDASMFGGVSFVNAGLVPKPQRRRGPPVADERTETRAREGAHSHIIA
ncbi:hypothetical protein C8R47DRAFT_1069229 [Mycena vitilis]|nr:hypothetical protein C8R47DRAFT_1069229 [Mycena vitilis]